MKKNHLIVSAILLVFLFACATAGQKYIHVDYTGNVSQTGNGTIGISAFKDNRKNQGTGYIGNRVLLDNSQETYFVNGMDLARTLTRTTSTFIEKKGYLTQEINDWELTPEGVSNADKSMSHLLAGTIEKFECNAKKRGGHTSMILDINLTFYLGDAAVNTLKTIPVSFSLEKTEMTFTREKLEKFVNDSIAEILEKALIIE